MGWDIVYLSEDQSTPDVVLVVGGTRKVLGLLRLKRMGVPIVHRLDGILWLHKKHWPGLRRLIGAEARNFLIKIIHGYVADTVV